MPPETETAPSAAAVATPPAPEPAEGIDATGRAWKRVILDTPLKRAGGDVASVMVRHPLGGDCRGTTMSAIYAMDVVALAVVVPRVTEPTIHKAEFFAMNVEDCAAIGGEIVNFLLTKSQKAEAGLTT